jgi:hypothetical protein
MPTGNGNGIRTQIGESERIKERERERERGREREGEREREGAWARDEARNEGALRLCVMRNREA